ncbi:MAG: hypothetical protein CL920_32520 [Deltaproteobacteria bacterium]|nr:hypothetical protein [Deltaproteobacteria bacterium]
MRFVWHSGFATHTRLGSLPPDPTMLTHRLSCALRALGMLWLFPSLGCNFILKNTLAIGKLMQKR